MIAQVNRYWLVEGPKTALVYQKDRTARETLYDPIEELTTDGVVNTEHFWVGMKNWWANTLDLPKAQLGHIQLKSFMARMQSIFGIFTLFSAARIITGAQSLINIPPAFAVLMLTYSPKGQGLWDFTARGSQLYDEQYDDRLAQLTSVKVDLSQGLRINDIQQIQRGFDGMVDLYRKGKSGEVTSDVEAIVNSPEHFLEALAQTPPEARKKFQDFIKASENMETAMESGSDDKAVENASQELRNQYADSDPEFKATILKLKASDLYEYSMLHPPFAVKGNPWVQPLHGWVSAIIVTRLMLKVSLHTFANAAWMTQIGHGLVLAAAYYAGMYALDHVAVYAAQHHQEWLNWFKHFGSGLVNERGNVLNLDQTSSPKGKSSKFGTNCEMTLKGV